MNKIKHLEFIENVVERMARNSLRFKEFALAIASICTTILCSTNVNKHMILLLILPMLACWFLDARYLLEERKFRKLYDVVRVKTETEIDYSMNPNECSNKIGDKKYCIVNCLFSWSVSLFYLILIGLIVVAFFLI